MSEGSDLVVVKFYKSIPLTSAKAVEYLHKQFDCYRYCNDTSCCSTIPDVYVEGYVSNLRTMNIKTACTKCAVQLKSKCLTSITSPESCGTSPVIDSSFYLNQPVFDVSNVITQSNTCSEAMRKIYSFQDFFVLNQGEVLTQCSHIDRLACCKGIYTGGPGLCGEYWGPTNSTGACDPIMIAYCAEPQNSRDAACGCILSPYPIPQCQDKRCAFDQDAIRLAHQDQMCQGQYITCLQYIQFDAESKGNLIEGTLQEDCEGTYEDRSGGSPTTGVDPTSQRAEATFPVGMLVVVIIIAVVALIGAVMFSALSKNKKEKNE